MNSLRGRIAISCTLLLTCTVACISLLETITFRSILFDERSLLNSRISDEVADYVTHVGLPQTLDRWGSAMTFVQLDEQLPGGALTILGKSSELGVDVLQEHDDKERGRRILLSNRMVLFKNRHVIVRVASDLSDIDDTLRRTQMFILWITLFAVPLVAFLSTIVSRNAIRPINDLIHTMQQINSEQLDQRVGFEERADELGELARTFDAMLDRLRASFERERRFIADASHELKTPLTVIHSNAQMLLRWAQNEEAIRNESIEAIITESKGLGLLIEELLLLARIDSGDLVIQDRVDLVQLCGELVRYLQERAGTRPITISLEAHGPPTELTIFGNAILLQRIFSNLLENALKFTHEGTITVILRRFPNIIEVLVSDTGIGIAETELERVFERLYRSDGSRTRQTEGFGLGLSIAEAFVRLHQGKIFAQQRPGGGTNLIVQLPVKQSVLTP